MKEVKKEREEVPSSVLLLPTHPQRALQGLTIVHGHRLDWGHRLWVASRVTVARLWVGRVYPLARQTEAALETPGGRARA